jgi:hypothetical protein
VNWAIRIVVFMGGAWGQVSPHIIWPSCITIKKLNMKLKPLFCLWDFFLILTFKDFLFEETFREMISKFKGLFAWHWHGKRISSNTICSFRAWKTAHRAWNKQIKYVINNSRLRIGWLVIINLIPRLFMVNQHCARL